MKPVAIHHVSVNVSDVDEARQFYTDVLGAIPRSDRPDFAFKGAWLDFGGQQLHLIKGDLPARVGQHCAILVDELDSVVDELRAQGIEVSDPVPVGRARQAFLCDPSGNGIELHELPMG